MGVGDEQHDGVQYPGDTDELSKITEGGTDQDHADETHVEGPGLDALDEKDPTRSPTAAAASDAGGEAQASSVGEDGPFPGAAL